MIKKVSFLFILICSCLFSETALNALAKESTLAIVKPDAVAKNCIGQILARYEKEGLRIAALKMTILSPEQAQEFYAIHAERPFFKDLIQLMTSGPAVVIVLEGDNAVKRNREIIGSEDKPGSLRALFGSSKTNNAVHGSDSLDNAKQEIGFFFSQKHLQERF